MHCTYKWPKRPRYTYFGQVYMLKIEIEMAFAKIDVHPDRLDRRSGKFGVDLDL